MNDIIPNIYHFIYENNKYLEDIDIFSYFSIKSTLEINNPKSIYFYYINLPTGYLWNKIKPNLILEKINIPKIYYNNLLLFFKKYKKQLIYYYLKKIGGIYIDIHTITLNNFSELLKYNFVKSINDEIICSEKNGYLCSKYLDYYIKLNNDLNSSRIINNENINNYEILYIDSQFINFFGIQNINGNLINNYIIDNLKYGGSLDYNSNNEEHISKILYEEIYDYNFSNYFYLIKNCYFLCIKNNIGIISIYDIFNKNTIYSLLVKYVLSYKLINKNIIIDYTSTEIKNKLEYINNIDAILWINLDSSVERRNNMLNILSNFNVLNIRISAFDGNFNHHIKTDYFLCENENYPNYSNKEYAILKSHLNAIETYLNFNIDNLKYKTALIFEDDISLDFINYWNIDTKTIVENAPKDWDIIMLGYFSLNINRKELYSKWNNEWSGLSYLINYDNIKKIKNLKKDEKWICKKDDLMVSDNYIFSKVNTYVYKYPLFTFPNENNSTFHDDHLQYHKIYKICNYLTLENIYDKLVQN